ncbi:MAG: hypothetical protein J6Y57_05110, partial [Lachnospiraceae bacterium]|nr:hypothetical protein [Lachnospiraceae bacterium]
GLTNMVEDEDIRMVVKAQRDVVQIVEELIKVANHNGGSDNIGVVIIQTEDSSDNKEVSR